MSDNSKIRAARTRAEGTKKLLKTIKDTEYLMRKMSQMEQKIRSLEQEIIQLKDK